MQNIDNDKIILDRALEALDIQSEGITFYIESYAAGVYTRGIELNWEQLKGVVRDELLP